MTPRLMTMTEVMRAGGYKSRSSVYRAIDRKELPRPLKRGGQSVWVESEVMDAILEQIKTLPRMGQSMGQTRKIA